MTAYLALHSLRPKQRLTTPESATIPGVPGEALLGLQPGERDTVHDLLYGMLLPSGGDAALTLADGVAGSVDAFVARMNAAAQRLGLDHTHYATPVGLDTPGNYSTAADLAKLAAVLLRERAFRRIVDSRRATLRGGAEVRRVVNRNDLVGRVPWVNGVKTGYTLDARYVLVASGRRHGVQLVAATLGAPSEAARDLDSLELLRYGFSLYRPRSVAAAGEPLARPRVRYREARLPLLAAHGVRLWARPGEPVEVRAHAPASVAGPVRRGRKVGTATIITGDDARATVALRSARSVPPPSVPGGLEEFVPGSPSRVAVGAVGLAGLALGLGLAALLVRSRTMGRLPARRRRAA
jgi:D-alanyl-D-alanine carboxypeptidase (penicillin-binding protein 5/6)